VVRQTEMADIDRLALLFLTLAEPAVVPLLEFLTAGERDVPACAIRMNCPATVIESHLTVLEDLGWISRRHDRYLLADQRVTEFIQLARALVDNKAAALMQCEHLDGTPPWR